MHFVYDARELLRALVVTTMESATPQVRRRIRVLLNLSITGCSRKIFRTELHVTRYLLSESARDKRQHEINTRRDTGRCPDTAILNKALFYDLNITQGSQAFK